MPKKKTREAKLAQNCEIFELRKQGLSLASIGQKYGITRQAIFKKLKEITGDYYQHFMDDVSQVKLDQIARHEEYKQQCLSKWFETFDIAYLEMVRKLDADDRKILGADAPIKTINADIDVTKLTEEELRSIISFKSQG